MMLATWRQRPQRLQSSDLHMVLKHRVSRGEFAGPMIILQRPFWILGLCTTDAILLVRLGCLAGGQHFRSGYSMLTVSPAVSKGYKGSLSVCQLPRCN